MEPTTLQSELAISAPWQCFLCLEPIRPCERADACSFEIGDPDGGLVRRSHGDCAEQNGLVPEEGTSEWHFYEWACPTARMGGDS